MANGTQAAAPAMAIPQMMVKGTCGTCDAFERFHGNPTLGKCIRHAPTAVICRYVPISRLDPKGQMVQVLEGQIDGAFPSTQQSLTCREYVEAEMPDYIPPRPPADAGLTAFEPAAEPDGAANDAVAAEPSSE